MEAAVRAGVQQARIPERERERVLAVALKLAAEPVCCQVNKHGNKDLFKVATAAAAAAGELVLGRFYSAAKAATCLIGHARKLATSSMVAPGAAPADILAALPSVLPCDGNRAGGKRSRAAVGSGKRSSSSSTSKRALAVGGRSARGGAGAAAGVGCVVVRLVTADRNGEEFKFVYGQGSDPHAAHAEGWEAVLSRPPCEDSRLYVFRCRRTPGGGEERLPAFVVAPSAELDKLLTPRGVPLQWGLYPWGVRDTAEEAASIPARTPLGVYLGHVLGHV